MSEHKILHSFIIYLKSILVKCQTSNISNISVGNEIVITCRGCSNYILILDWTPGFNVLGKDNCEMRRKTFKLLDLMHLILEVWNESTFI